MNSGWFAESLKYAAWTALLSAGLLCLLLFGEALGF